MTCFLEVTNSDCVKWWYYLFLSHYLQHEVFCLGAILALVRARLWRSLLLHIIRSTPTCLKEHHTPACLQKHHTLQPFCSRTQSMFVWGQAFNKIKLSHGKHCHGDADSSPPQVTAWSKVITSHTHCLSILEQFLVPIQHCWFNHEAVVGGKHASKPTCNYIVTKVGSTVPESATTTTWWLKLGALC